MKNLLVIVSMCLLVSCSSGGDGESMNEEIVGQWVYEYAGGTIGDYSTHLYGIIDIHSSGLVDFYVYTDAKKYSQYVGWMQDSNDTECEYIGSNTISGNKTTINDAEITFTPSSGRLLVRENSGGEESTNEYERGEIPWRCEPDE